MFWKMLKKKKRFSPEIFIKFFLLTPVQAPATHLMTRLCHCLVVGIYVIICAHSFFQMFLEKQIHLNCNCTHFLEMLFSKLFHVYFMNRATLWVSNRLLNRIPKIFSIPQWTTIDIKLDMSETKAAKSRRKAHWKHWACPFLKKKWLRGECRVVDKYTCSRHDTRVCSFIL